jgi:hypothetical protein
MSTITRKIAAVVRGRWNLVRATGDAGVTAIEWVIFALLALAVAGTVAAAVTAFVNTKAAGIQ